jgi:hypothetical protein
MQRFFMVLTGAATLACSQPRERQVAKTDTAASQADLTLPDTVSRRDTSITLSSRSDARVPPVEQQIEPRAAETTTPARPRRTKARIPRAVKPPPDTAVQGYAPAGTPDTTSSRDSAPASRSVPEESTRTDSSRPRPDSTPPPPTDSAIPSRDTISIVETSPPVEPSPAPPESVSPRRADSSDVARPRRDTLATRAVDTTSTPPADTMVASATRANVAARTLRVGTEIHASLNDSITSRRDTVGQIVSAHVMQNVKGPNGRTLIAAGTPVQFTVTRIRPARSKNSQGRLALDVNGFEIEGQLLPVEAEVRPVPRELRGRGVGGSEVAKVGGGAAAGAILGRVIGGNTRGAVIGGVAGAAAGAVVADQTATRDVVVKAKTPVVFVLTAPLVVAP